MKTNSALKYLGLNTKDNKKYQDSYVLQPVFLERSEYEIEF